MSTPTAKQLLNAFGEFRAEWQQDLVREFFVEPDYLRRLEDKRPCLLIGGRGTGKTTALKSLLYNSLDRTLSRDGEGVTPPYLGIYLRLNKNQVRAFRGGNPKAPWDKTFAHYFNLLICAEFCGLYLALNTREPSENWATDSVAISKRLALKECHSIAELSAAIAESIADLETYINNPESTDPPKLSIAEAPVTFFARTLARHEACRNRMLYCCIDEYENLLDYQQEIANAYIKHAEPPLTYKIGVRKGGLRTRRTIGTEDLLQTPDDLDEIDISTCEFERFALEVVKKRLNWVRKSDERVPLNPEELLPGLSRTAEAQLLGADRVSERVIDELSATPEIRDWVKTELGIDAYFLKFWRESSGDPLSELAHDWRESPQKWDERLDNYWYASLFWLSKGRKGARIRKYYCGVRTFLGLASGNIRYFLHLIYEGVNAELTNREGAFGGSSKRPLVISFKSQTEGARAVARRRLDQLEGIGERGVQLKRLLLAIGKIFFEFARQPVGHTPEVTQFVLSGDEHAQYKIRELLLEGVSHLVFEVTPRTKATSEAEIRDEEFRIHPIFCPFFEYSHRRKRRAIFDAEILLSAINEQPSQAIRELLGTRAATSADALPEQLAMFSQFFDAGSGDANQ